MPSTWKLTFISTLCMEIFSELCHAYENIPFLCPCFHYSVTCIAFCCSQKQVINLLRKFHWSGISVFCGWHDHFISTRKVIQWKWVRMNRNRRPYIFEIKKIIKLIIYFRGFFAILKSVFSSMELNCIIINMKYIYVRRKGNLKSLIHLFTHLAA